jgi:uncharacterized protein (AIM24 family)
MQRSPQKQEIRLAEGELMALRGARGARLECSAGLVWLTVEGLPDDFLLATGEHLSIGNNGLVLIEGSPSGAFRWVRALPWPIRGARRVLDWLRCRR